MEKTGGPVPAWGIVAAITVVVLTSCGPSPATRLYEKQLAALGQAHEPSPGTGGTSGEVTFEPPLDRAALVRAVLARNPTLAAARHAWRAALARYPQETSLEDPMVSYMMAPLSVAGEVPFGHSVQVSQRLPFPGRLGAQGAAALAEAEAARASYEAERLRLALAASLLYDDYFVVERSLAINAEHRRLLGELKESALAQYTVGRAAQQDPLEAEVALGHVDHERITLESRRTVIVAMLNGLLHRSPGEPLPPPPAELPLPADAPRELDALVEIALAGRPELAAERARIRAGEATIDRANLASYPDLEVMAQYSSMWGMPEHRWMVGVGLALPIWRDRRAAGVDEARARVAGSRSALAAAADRLRVEVAEAVARLEEARHVVHLYEARLVPAARDQVAAARAGFVAGRNTFSSLVAAQDNLRTVELRQLVARADLSRRLAELERTLGRVPGLGDSADGGGR